MERVNVNVKHKNTSIWFDLVRFDSIRLPNTTQFQLKSLLCTIDVFAKRIIRMCTVSTNKNKRLVWADAMFMALMERKYFDFFWHIYKKSNIKSKSMIELSQLYITPMWEGFMWVCGVCIGQYTCIVSILSIAYPKHSIEKEFSVKELPCSIIFKMVVTKRHVAIDQLCLCVPGTLYLYRADAMYTLVKDAFF